ncbi:MAG: ATP-binding protein, partial [Smithella sp.]
SRYKFKTYDEVLKAIEVLIVEDHDFKTLAIDTLDVVEQLIFNQVCIENNVSAIAKIKYGNGYKIARCMWDDFIKRITALRDKRKMTVVLICHALIKPYNDPMGDSYDRYILNINEKSQEKFTHWADAILFANYKVSRVKEDAGFSEKTKAVAERRVLFTTDHPAHVAKNRFNLPNELPLDWNAFLHHYNEFAKSKTSGNA